jgi:hypothetical protein
MTLSLSFGNIEIRSVTMITRRNGHQKDRAQAGQNTEKIDAKQDHEVEAEPFPGSKWLLLLLRNENGARTEKQNRGQ